MLRVREPMGDGDGDRWDVRDERGDILFLFGKAKNKNILKTLHLELQWVVDIQNHYSWFLNFLSNSNQVGTKFWACKDVK